MHKLPYTVLSLGKSNPSSQILFFVIALVILLLCPIPIAFFPSFTPLIFSLTFSMVVLTGVRTIDKQSKHQYLGYILGFFGVVFIWLSFLGPQIWLIWLRSITLFGFVNFLGFHIFRKIFFHNEMSLDIILAAIAGYMLLGFGGGLLCQIVELLLPGSFRLEDNINLFQLTYFSYSSLITLGFGDIIPHTPSAKSLALIISISGQLYLTIIVAILVGKFLSAPKV